MARHITIKKEWLVAEPFLRAALHFRNCKLAESEGGGAASVEWRETEGAKFSAPPHLFLCAKRASEVLISSYQLR